MRDVAYFLTLPWTMRAGEREDDGRYYYMTIDELPGFVVSADSLEELDSEFWDALEGYLNSYLEHGEEPPVPERHRMQAAVARQARKELSSPQVQKKSEATSAGFNLESVRPFPEQTRTGPRPVTPAAAP